MHSDNDLALMLSEPEHLLDQIDEDLDSLSFEDLPQISLSTTTGGPGDMPPYREIEDGVPKHRILDAILTPFSDRIHLVCCEQMNYCKAKDDYADSLNLCKAVIDGFASSALVFPLPAATVAAYCVQTLLLDRICKCKESRETAQC